jgi:hypothetical protein
MSGGGHESSETADTCDDSRHLSPSHDSTIPFLAFSMFSLTINNPVLAVCCNSRLGLLYLRNSAVRSSSSHFATCMLRKVPGGGGCAIAYAIGPRRGVTREQAGFETEVSSAWHHHARKETPSSRNHQRAIIRFSERCNSHARGSRCGTAIGGSGDHRSHDGSVDVDGR